MQVSYIAKGVSYDKDNGVSLFVGRRTDDPTPREFHYIFELDIDPTQDMTLCFQKRGRYLAGFSYQLNPKAVEDGYLAIKLSNIVDIPKSNCMIKSALSGRSAGKYIRGKELNTGSIGLCLTKAEPDMIVHEEKGGAR